MKTKVSQPIAVPSLAEANPEYAALFEKKRALGRERAANQREIDAQHEKIRTATVPESKVKASKRVAALLGDETTESETADRERLRVLYERDIDLKAALDVIKDRLSSERNRASRTITDQLADTHKALVADICASMLKLRDAAKAYDNLRYEFEAKDVAWSRLQPMGVPFVGHVGVYLRDAAARGFLDKKSIPAELRQ